MLRDVLNPGVLSIRMTIIYDAMESIMNPPTKEIINVMPQITEYLTEILVLSCNLKSCSSPSISLDKKANPLNGFTSPGPILPTEVNSRHLS